MVIAILMQVFLIAPFLLAVGTIIWIGFRGKPAWSAPICRRCRYDLRGHNPEKVTNCPECGADLLAPKAVLFMRGQGRRWGLIAWGAGLLVTPAIVVGVGVLVVTMMQASGASGSGYVSPSQLSGMTTQQLIANQLPGRVDEPWVWDVLETRVANGTLTQAEAEAAIDVLINHMNANGWTGPLSWQGDFVRQARAAGLISDAKLAELAIAFHGNKPRIEPIPRVRSTDQPLLVDLRYGNSWDINDTDQLLWGVTEVTVDGQPVNFTIPDSWSESRTIRLDELPPPGEHKLTVGYRIALTDSQKLIGLDADNLAVDDWPQTWHEEDGQIEAAFTVYGPDEPIVGTTTDPARDPLTSRMLGIEHAVIQQEGSHKKLVIEFKRPAVYDPPVSFDASVVIDGQTHKLGRLMLLPGPTGGNITSGLETTTKLQDLADDVRSIDIILTPNPKHAERYAHISEIWGKEVRLEGIKLQRLDLERQ